MTQPLLDAADHALISPVVAVLPPTGLACRGRNRLAATGSGNRPGPVTGEGRPTMEERFDRRTLLTRGLVAGGALALPYVFNDAARAVVGGSDASMADGRRQCDRVLLRPHAELPGPVRPQRGLLQRIRAW